MLYFIAKKITISRLFKKKMNMLYFPIHIVLHFKTIFPVKLFKAVHKFYVPCHYFFYYENYRVKSSNFMITKYQLICFQFY